MLSLISLFLLLDIFHLFFFSIISELSCPVASCSCLYIPGFVLLTVSSETFCKLPSCDLSVMANWIHWLNFSFTRVAFQHSLNSTKSASATLKQGKQLQSIRSAFKWNFVFDPKEISMKTICVYLKMAVEEVVKNTLPVFAVYLWSEVRGR